MGFLEAPRRVEHLAPLLRARPELRGLQAQAAALRAVSAKNAASYAEGDTLRFYVRDLFNQERFYARTGRLARQAPGLNVWIDAHALYPAALLQQVADSLAYYAVRDGGILSVLNAHFGNFPNVDGDGRVDVLLLDIPDPFAQTGGYVAGFFDPVNLTDEPFSNRRDLVYLDLYPTILRDGAVRAAEAAATFAHEAQHLIQARYERAPEATFVNEGLSELAEILCGFRPRSAEAYADEPNRPLLDWRYDDPYADYARASLWTHYLYETLGPDAVRTLAQSPVTGLEAYREVLREAGASGLEETFEQWGHDLLRGTAYQGGGRVRLRVQARPTENLPAAEHAPVPALSHLFARVPLAADVRVETGGVPLAVAGQFDYPDGGSAFFEGTRAPVNEFASARPHGTLSLVLSNTTARTDTRGPPTGVVFTGTASGRRRVLGYDDAVPDAFRDHASHLMLDAPGNAIGLAFGPGEAVWIEAVSARLVFRSELQGSGVPADAPREFVVQLFRVENGVPGAALTPPRRVTVSRPHGNLRFETVSLRDDYATLAALRDSFAVVLRNVDGTNNPFAVALDRNASAMGLYFDAVPQRWQGLHHRQVQGASLAGFAPMIRAHAVAPERAEAVPPARFSVRHTFDRVELHVPASVARDTLRSRAVARTASGAWNGVLKTDGDRAFFAFPLDVGGRYTFSVRLADETGVVRDATLAWAMPQRHAAEIAGVYPTPTAGRVTLVYHAFAEAEAEVVLYDVLGRAVLRHAPPRLAPGITRDALDLGALASGLYLARLRVRGASGAFDPFPGATPIVVAR